MACRTDDKLGTAITEAIIHDYGTSAFLSRLSDPFWFQAFGAVMGMDWHSSGITTSVMGALKRGLAPRADELGSTSAAAAAGSRATRRRSCARLQTAVASTAKPGAHQPAYRADGQQCHRRRISDLPAQFRCHGEWRVGRRAAGSERSQRHGAPLSLALGLGQRFCRPPHTGIVGENQGTIMNLVDAEAKPAQTAMLEIAQEHPEKTLMRARHLRMPEHHEVRAENVDLKRLGAVLAVAYERDLHDFAELLLLENLGPRTLQSLALVAEVVHGAPSRFTDPARFSFAHGGKDRHPFPVPLKTYDESLNFLALARLSKGRGKEKLDGFRRLERFVHAVETSSTEADFDAVIAHEKAISPSLDGRSVFDDKPRQRQLKLF